MTYFHHWYIYGVKLIKDIIDKNGRPMLPNDIHKMYGINMSNYLEYHGLINAIPNAWKKTLDKGGTNTSKLIYDEYTLYVNLINNNKDICFSYNTFYWSLVDKNAKPAVPAETKWWNLLDIEPEKLKKIL